MPTPGDIICGDVKLEALAPTSLGAEVFQPVFVARRGDAGETIWLTVVEGLFTPTSMNMSTFMAGANGMLGMRHPALVRVVLVDREVDYSVVGYEALPGAEPMTDIITRGGSRSLLGRTAIETARGLAFLHRRDMLHGALTPSTVVMWEGMPVLWEHGIAALCTPSVFGPRARSLGGDVVAPEVPGGAQLTPAADVFAWGAVLASVASGMLGSEAVAAVQGKDVDEGRQGALFDLIRESLSAEANERPRDGTHLLERLLALQLDSPTETRGDGAAADAGKPASTGGGDPDLSDLARRYLDEMSAVEKRSGDTNPPPAAVPHRVDDSESSGALGRLQLKKARFRSDSQKLVGFVDDAPRDSEGSSDSTPIIVTTDPTPIPQVPTPPAKPAGKAIPPPPPIGRSLPAEDSAANAIPLWKAASESKPRIAPPVPATPPPPKPAPEPPAAPTGVPPALSLDTPGPEADAEAELRDAFADLTAAADAETRKRDSGPGLVFGNVPDDPTADFDQAQTPAGVPQSLAKAADTTPVPTRLPDPDVAPKTGGWIRPAERPDDPHEAAVQAKLPPAQDYGDGVHKRTFEPGAPTATGDDTTPREGLAVAPAEAAAKPSGREDSGLAKLRKLWPRKAQAAAPRGAEPDSLEDASGQQEAIARDVLADLERSTQETKRKRKRKSKRNAADLEVADAPDDREAKDAEPPAPSDPDALPPVASPAAPGRAQPVAPFVPPRAVGPHGPRGPLLSGALVVLLGAVAFVATLRAAEHRGGLDKLIAGAAAGPAPESSTPAASSMPAGGPSCPEGTAAVPSAEAPDPSNSIVCIDVAEFPSTGEIPTTGIDFAEAERLCEGRGRRLCTTEEWQRSCRGVEARKFPYGNERERERCHTSTKGELAAAGSYPACVTPEGVTDLVGNAAEWVAEGIALGGSATTRSASCQTKLRPGKRAKRAGIGARCCVDVVP